MAAIFSDLIPFADQRLSDCSGGACVENACGHASSSDYMSHLQSFVLKRIVWLVIGTRQWWVKSVMQASSRLSSKEWPALRASLLCVAGSHS